MTRLSALVPALAAVAALGCAGAAHADGGVKVGVLSCNVASGWGMVFGSSKSLHCTFSPTGRASENYVGKINKFGVDIGYQHAGVILWTVLAPTNDIAPGSLAGSYGGASAQATAGVGAGANALVGGSNKSLQLLPLSIEGTTGLNVAAGVAGIDLTYVK